jgi:hypothetical protein
MQVIEVYAYEILKKPLLYPNGIDTLITLIEKSKILKFYQTFSEYIKDSAHL